MQMYYTADGQNSKKMLLSLFFAMIFYCPVALCKNSSTNTQFVSFHAFPKTGEIHRRHFVDMPTSLLKSYHILQFVLCILHPTISKKLTNIKKLKPAATPSIFLSNASQEKRSQVIVIFVLRNLIRCPRKLHVVQVDTNEVVYHALFKKLIHKKN